MKRHRKFTARQRVHVVLEGLQGDTSVPEVWRRHQISSTLYYRWRDQLFENAERLFEKKGKRSEEELEGLETENRRLKEVTAEITSENLELKKNAWSLEDHATLPRELWPVIFAEVERTREQSGWTTERTLRTLGVSRATFYRQRRTREEERQPPLRPVVVQAVTAEERAAVVAFKFQHPELGHRALAWTMVDEDVAYLSPSTVYRILSGAGLLQPWERGKRGTGKKAPRPSRPNELWQTDLRHVKMMEWTFYLLVFIDVFSQYVPYWELLRWMDGETVSLAALSALESRPEPERARVTVQSDNRSAFVSTDFARVLREHGIGHTRIHPYTPEQNAFVERVLRTLGDPLHEGELASFHQAEESFGEIIDGYNHRRLHSSIGYVTPAATQSGEADRTQQKRRTKLVAASHRRKEENLKLWQRSLALAACPEDRIPQTTAN